MSQGLSIQSVNPQQGLKIEAPKKPELPLDGVGPKKPVSFQNAVIAELEKIRGAVVEPPKPNINIKGLSELITYQNRVSQVHLGVELVSRFADSLMQSVKRLQQGS